MEIYLKHRERNQLLCIKKYAQGSKQIEVYRNSEISYSQDDERSIDEAHSWYASDTSQVNVNGKWESVKNWLKSDKNGFETALNKAKETINNF